MSLRRNRKPSESSSSEKAVPGFGDFGLYMHQKKQKLKDQDKERDIIAEPDLPKIFNGLRIHINGYTDVSLQELKSIILRYGGEYEHYYSKSDVYSPLLLHSISTDVVKPDWILDCVKHMTLLPWWQYRLIEDRLPSQKQLTFAKPNLQESRNQESQSTAISLAVPADFTISDSPPADLLASVTAVSNDANVDTGALSFNLSNSSEPNKPEHDDSLQTAASERPISPNQTMDSEQQSINPDLRSEWARKNTSIAPDFLSKFFAQSRLHHLSAWKQELKAITSPIRKSLAAKSALRRTSRTTKTIMHIDMDCFFASVALRDRPWLKDKPVGISHAGNSAINGMSDVASCNYVARGFGVRNGMTIGRAKSLCPKLMLLPYEFDKYRAVSKDLNDILQEYADDLQAVSCDEAYIDVSSHMTERNKGQEVSLAHEIRKKIFDKTGCHASVGIGSSLLLARMATHKAKPNDAYYLPDDEVKTFLDPLPADNLPGVGWHLSDKLENMGIKTCADLRKVSKEVLKSELGNKKGETLFNFVRGIDDRQLNESTARKSVGAEVNWGIRFEEQSQVDKFMVELSEEVSRRLNEVNCKAKQLTLKIKRKSPDAPDPRKTLGHGICDSLSKSVNLFVATDDSKLIAKECISMLKSMKIPPVDLRGIGIQTTKLDEGGVGAKGQRSLFEFSKKESHEKAHVRTGDQSSVEDFKARWSVEVKSRDDTLNSGTATKGQRMMFEFSKKEMNEGVTLPKVQNITEGSEAPPPMKDVVDIVNRSDEISRPKQPTTLTKAVEKSIPDIDPSTFAELPSDIQNEIARIYNIQVQDLLREKPKSPIRSPSPLHQHSNVAGPSKQPPHQLSDDDSLPDVVEVASSQEQGQIDGSVYHELPPEIQKEYASQYRRRKGKSKIADNTTKPQNSEITTIFPEDSAHELEKYQLSSVTVEDTPKTNVDSITFSQIDPSFLSALPQNIRLELQVSYKRPALAPSPPKKPSKISPNSKRKRQLKKPAGRLNTSFTLTQKWGRDIDELDGVDEGIDKEYLQALPSDIRREVIKSIQLEQETKKRKEQTITAETIIHEVKNSHHRHEPTGATIQPSIPSFFGRTTVPEVRKLMKQWVSSSANPCDLDADSNPSDEDTQFIVNYFISLIESKQLEMVRLLLLYLRRLTSNCSHAWQSMTEHVVQEVQKNVVKFYGDVKLML
ncbi:hypothetical protein BKA69DRAFT_1045779 [Paraphysoderma sedebokerense]|nr:hypothetical protein BKA69DRAFT_1045779 [Paraphysoderma sedebokerense]